MAVNAAHIADDEADEKTGFPILAWTVSSELVHLLPICFLKVPSRALLQADASFSQDSTPPIGGPLVKLLDVLE